MQEGNKDLLYLLRILEAVGKILFYTKDYVTDAFLFSNHQKDYNASLLLLLHIGEQTAKVSSNTKQKFPEIDWKIIKDFRNRVAHDYINVDKLIVFSVIKQQLPLLQNQLILCIKKQIDDNVFSKEELEISRGSIFYEHIDFSEL
jgi:uncharacterized protein with HEPN domain